MFSFCFFLISFKRNLKKTKKHNIIYIYINNNNSNHVLINILFECCLNIYFSFARQ